MLDVAHDDSMIPDGVELLSVRQVAWMLGCGQSVVRQRDKQRMLPKPVRLGGSVKWRRRELIDWISADCPSRQIWEQMRGGCIG